MSTRLGPFASILRDFAPGLGSKHFTHTTLLLYLLRLLLHHPTRLVPFRRLH